MAQPQKLTPELKRLIASLPIEQAASIRSLSCMYGADLLASAHCGINGTPPIPRGIWQHGWIPHYHAICPSMVICGEGSYSERKETESFFVARKDEQDYLRSMGYPHAEAIGLPITYLPPIEQPRLQSRLLVMPVHSIRTTSLQLDFEAYADSIDAIRSKFEEVVVCVHPSCFAKGYWVDSFGKRGYPIVSGATMYDRNGLHRMQRLMSGFDCITSNGFGSFLAYGAYFGARVSVFGPESERSEEDYKNLPSASAFPGGFWKLETQATLKLEYPFLSCDPWKAIVNDEWGRHELGANQKPEPSHLRKLFGWSPKKVLRDRCENTVKSVASTVGKKLGHTRRMLFRSEYRIVNKVFAQVARPIDGERRSVVVNGKTLDILCGALAREEFIDVYMDKSYHVRLRDNPGRLIDGNAGSGMLMAYLKQEYPDAEIMAFEPRTEQFGCLEENAKRLGISRESIFKGRPEKENSTSFWLDRGVGGRRTQQTDFAGRTTRVQNRDIRELISVPVAFLRLDLTDAEIDILEYAQPQLHNVSNIVVEYAALFGGKQKLASLLRVLEEAGFRVHIKELFGSPSPLSEQEIDEADFACDHRLRIFGFR